MGTPQRADHPENPRLVSVLERALGTGAKVDIYRRPAAPTGAPDVLGPKAYLCVAPGEPVVTLRVNPADSLQQARAFYALPDVVASLVRLRAETAWGVRANFHFGFFSRGFCWTCNERDVEEYAALWVRRIGTEKAVPREDWDTYWSWLVDERIACPSDRAEFERIFVRTRRPNATPRPGVVLERRWPIAEALGSEGDDALVGAVRGALDEALAVLRG